MASLPKRTCAQALLALALFLALSPPAAHAVAPRIAVAQSSSFVQQVVSLTNQERAKHGLPPLELDTALCNSALAHSQDMADNDYFSHTGLNGSTVDQRIRAAGYTPLWAYGENIAAGQVSPEEVVSAWMNSEGHRANILSPHYEHIGVGYAEKPGSTYVHYWTQHFASHSELVRPEEATPVPPQPTSTPVPTRLPTVALTRVAPTPIPTPTPRRIDPAATAAPALPTPTGSAPAASATLSVVQDRARQVLALLNQERARAGLPALAPHPALALAAQEHSTAMARNDLFSRSVAGGSTLEQRVARADLHSAPALAEAIAAGQATPEQVVGAWMAAPNSRRLILDPAAGLAGVGYAYRGDGAYRHYWTLDLAGRQEAPAHLVSPLPAGRLLWLRHCLPGLVRRFGLARVS